MSMVRIICTGCGLRPIGEPQLSERCPECNAVLRPMGRLEAMVDRWFAPPAQVASDMHRRHRQLVELIWTADGRGRDFYESIRPRGVSYDRFVERVTEVVCAGLSEGWIVAELPTAPAVNEDAYRIIFPDPERFAEHVVRLFQPEQRR